MEITLTGLFRYEKNPFNLMKRLNRLDESGCKEIRIRRCEYISIKKLKKVLYDYSNDGYSLKEIEYLIRTCEV